jgi:hypothetical protein
MQGVVNRVRLSRIHRHRGVRRVAVAIAGLVLSLAVVTGLVSAGGRVYYCQAMRTLGFDPCGVAEHGRSADGERSACPSHADCCETWTLPSMPAATAASDPPVAPAPLVSIMAPSEVLAALFERGPAAPAVRSLERWRVPPRPPGEERSHLMVFLI